MPWKFNPFTDTFDIVGIKTFRGVLSTAPSSPQEGWTYIDSDTHRHYIYYGGNWQAMQELIAAAAEFLLLETGDAILLENGDKLALE